jgi:curved DNA-binding protein CbpA
VTEVRVNHSIDAYKVLQVDPGAEAVVLHAAYRALARLYHPDGLMPDAARMAVINRAYALVGRADCRQRYDADRLRLKPVGPGLVERDRYDPWVASGGLAARSGARDHVGDAALDFGRYAGWRLAELARHDPDYLRWLCRQSAGVRYREQILQLLPHEPDLDRRGKSVT